MLLRVGSDGDNIVSQFAVSYHNEAAELGVNLDDLYAALTTDAEVNPPEWNIHGRQVNVYKCVSLNSDPFFIFQLLSPLSFCHGSSSSLLLSSSSGDYLPRGSFLLLHHSLL